RHAARGRRVEAQRQDRPQELGRPLDRHDRRDAAERPADGGHLLRQLGPPRLERGRAPVGAAVKRLLLFVILLATLLLLLASPASSAHASVSSAHPYARLEVGDSGQRVKNLQWLMTGQPPT